MSAATAGEAIRSIIVNAGTAVGDKFYLDSAPENTAPPYATYNDNVSTSSMMSGDGKVLFYTRIMQINVWQTQEHEDPQLPVTIRELLNGAQIVVAGMTNAMTLHVQTANRVPEPIGSNLVHAEVTISMNLGSAVV